MKFLFVTETMDERVRGEESGTLQAVFLNHSGEENSEIENEQLHTGELRREV